MNETHKVCTKCNHRKPIEAFGLKRQKTRGVEYRRRTCRECDRISFSVVHTIWREKNRQHVRDYAKEAQRRRRGSRSPDELALFNEKQAIKAVNRRARLKKAVYLAYGGAKCACCGETEEFFLSIDHVNNDGYILRKNGQATGEQLMALVLKQGCPPDYQILCMNCNHGKARNGGICPHETGKVQRLERKLVGSSDPKPPALFCEEVMI